MKTPRTEPNELRELAQLCGIQTFYLASDETMSEADPEVLMGLIRALGVPIERPKDVTSAIRERRLLAARRMMEPVLVVRSGRRTSFTVTLPERFEANFAWFTTEWEDGSTRREQLLTDSTPVATLELEGQRFHRYLVDYSAHHPDVPLGYHSLTLDVTDAGHAAASATSLVISAPPCPEPARGWGVSIPLYALRSQDDWGAGSYRDLAQLGAWASSKGAALAGGLPLYP
ncbi:MAG TPA: hypothetical protein VGG17_00660, partial [Acidimicrobiales bacterium]